MLIYQVPACDSVSVSLKFTQLYTLMVPYHGLREGATISRILSGKRPSRPELCTDNKVWQLAERCWSPAVPDRPTMEAVRRELYDIPMHPQTQSIL